MPCEGIENIGKSLQEVKIEQDENVSKVTDDKKAKEQCPEKEMSAAEECFENQENNPVAAGPACALCKKPDPKKRCSKRHPKCLTKMFCNETCESLAHEAKKSTGAKKETKPKTAATKKKGGKSAKDWKNTDSGQMSVR